MARREQPVSLGIIPEPGQPAETLVEALFHPAPTSGQRKRPVLPGRAVLFDEQLADQVRRLLAPHDVEVVVASSVERFEELFASLINYLEQMAKADGTSDLPDEKLRPLVGASERLLKAKPWEYAADNPPFGLASRQPGARPMYAAILGAEREVLGVALYTSLEDYENTRETGEALLTAPEFLDDAVEVLQAIRQRTFLVAFEPRDKLKPAYREQLARCGCQIQC